MDAVDLKLADEDIAAVRKAFATLAQVTREAKGGLQIIVLDHAPDGVWGDIPGITAFEEWREGKKLVPVEWVTAQTS